MPTLKVDDIAESTSSAGITLKDNVVIDAAKTLTTGTGVTTVSGNLQVDANTSLNGPVDLNGNALSDVSVVTTTGAVTAGGGVRSHGAVNCLGSDDATKQNITNANAIDCQSLSIAGTAFAVNLKAFGKITFADCAVGGTAATATLDKGFNCTVDASPIEGSAYAQINFTDDMLDTNYILLWQYDNPGATERDDAIDSAGTQHIAVTSRNTGYFRLASGGTSFNDHMNGVFNFVVVST